MGTGQRPKRQAAPERMLIGDPSSLHPEQKESIEAIECPIGSAILTHGEPLGFELQTTVHKSKFLFISVL